MKTITAKFKRGEEVVAVSVGTFERVPGIGTIAWVGENIVGNLGGVAPKEHYAELFEESMQHISSRSGLACEISSSGEWKSYAE